MSDVTITRRPVRTAGAGPRGARRAGRPGAHPRVPSHAPDREGHRVTVPGPHRHPLVPRPASGDGRPASPVVPKAGARRENGTIVEAG